MLKYKYKQEDKSIIFNEDQDLTPIEVRLPKQPAPSSIVGYGLPPDKQKWKRPSIPQKLFELNKNPKILLQDKATILKDDPEYYAEEIEFIEREWDRRINGVWWYINGKATYIPGCFYFYLCYWHLERGYPIYRDRDRKFFIFAEFVENDDKCFGFIYPKHRREGATTKAACWNYEYVSRQRRARGGIQSMTDGHAEIVFQKHIVPSWKKIPFWFKPIFSNTTDPKSSMDFFAPAQRSTRTNMGVDEMDELESSIDFGASGEGVYDGSRLERYHADEIGKTTTVDVYKRHLVARQCMSELDKIIGKCIYTSTAGEMTKGGGEAFKKLIEASDYGKRDDNGRTSSGLYPLFIPATEGFKIDEFGNSMKEESLQFLLNERKQALETEDFDKLNESTRQFPIRLRDCFRNASDADNFNMKIIQDQLDKYQFGNKDVVVGDFEWENGQQDGRVIFVPRANGKFKVSYLFDNPNDSNRFITTEGIREPANAKRFIGGGDTFKFTTVKGGKKSLGGGAVFMKRDHSIDKDTDPIEEWQTHRFVCTYLHRPKSKDDYTEDMLMMCIYYGCRMCPEINVPAIMDHFIRRGYIGYLHYVLDKKTGKYRKNPGYNTQVTERESIFRAYQSFIEKHGHRLVHDDLLTQLQEIREDMGDYDLFVAGGMCLIANEDENIYNYGDEDENNDEDLDEYFGYRNY
jgi:hypothetical protein